MIGISVETFHHILKPASVTVLQAQRSVLCTRNTEAWSRPSARNNDSSFRSASLTAVRPPLSPERGGKWFRGPREVRPVLPPRRSLHGWLALEEEEHALLRSSLKWRFKGSNPHTQIRLWPTGSRSQDAGFIKIEPRGVGGAARTLPRLLEPHNSLPVQQA